MNRDQHVVEDHVHRLSERQLAIPAGIASDNRPPRNRKDRQGGRPEEALNGFDYPLVPLVSVECQGAGRRAEVTSRKCRAGTCASRVGE